MHTFTRLLLRRASQRATPIFSRRIAKHFTVRGGRTTIKVTILVVLVLDTSPSFKAKGDETNALRSSGQTSVTNSNPNEQVWTPPAGDTPVVSLVPNEVNSKAIEEIKTKAEKGDAQAQYSLGACYSDGRGVAHDSAEAVKWCRKAAEQDYVPAQLDLGSYYYYGIGVAEDYVEAVRWFRKAAEQNNAGAQYYLGHCYALGQGVAQDYVQAYKWYNLSAAQDPFPNTIDERDRVGGVMTPNQIAEGQKLARNFKPRKAPKPGTAVSTTDLLDSRPLASGTGFFVSEDGYLISNAHVVEGGTQIRLVTNLGLLSAKVLNVDMANDLALLKASGRFAPLPIISSRTVKLGGTVATVGFPDPGLQGFAPKLAKGEIAALSGAGDDARYFQISVPLQPGNSGGALVDERGNVIGIVSAKLDAAAALAATGSLPENVNYAVKSSLLLSFLESLPAVSAKLKVPATAGRKFEDVVKSAQEAAVLVLVY
jgi:S1-C subfamily serine protease